MVGLHVTRMGFSIAGFLALAGLHLSCEANESRGSSLAQSSDLRQFAPQLILEGTEIAFDRSDLKALLSSELSSKKEKVKFDSIMTSNSWKKVVLKNTESPEIHLYKSIAHSSRPEFRYRFQGIGIFVNAAKSFSRKRVIKDSQWLVNRIFVALKRYTNDRSPQNSLIAIWWQASSKQRGMRWVFRAPQLGWSPLGRFEFYVMDQVSIESLSGGNIQVQGLYIRNRYTEADAWQPIYRIERNDQNWLFYAKSIGNETEVHKIPTEMTFYSQS